MNQPAEQPSTESTLPSITAYVIAYNEEEKIRSAIESVLWADEVILADSHSTDGTARIAEELGELAEFGPTM